MPVEELVNKCIVLRLQLW